jgi:SecD/SecF fusion protein
LEELIKMKKSRAVISLLLVAAIAVLMAYTVLIGFGKGHRGSYHNIKKGLDLAGGASITYQAVGEEPPTQEDLNDTKYKLQRRVDQYSTEAQVYTEGTNRLNIEIPGISGVAETNQILEDLGRPGSLYFIRQTDDAGNENYTLGVTEDGGVEYVLTKELDQIIADGDAVVTGTQVADAKAGYQQDDMGNKQIVVSLTFNDEGREAFAAATTKAFSAKESIGIYYDGHFISVPSVQAAITDGRAVITGESTIEDAENLASTIRIGGLKVELERLRSQIVGAQLGQDAIRTSKFAGMVGFGLVAVLMIVIYLLPGFAAVLALAIYILMMALVLNGFDITLTLPGIAGILLSIGMAVDANVIIFARIREELANGIGVKTAIKNGFSKALSAIIDGNVTTLIAAAVLAVLGSGTVKGFAYTLAIGIILSMITSLFVTRFLMSIFYGLGLTNKKLYGIGKKRTPIKFVEKRKIFFAISIAVVLAGFVAMGVFKAREGNILNYSLDFVGGTSTSVSFNEDMSLEQIESQVIPVFTEVTGDSNVQIQKVAGSNEVIFKSAVLDADKSTELSNQLVEKFSVDKDSITSETISSTISDEMKRDALIAVVVALILMLIYIWLRFKDIRFGASSVICLGHDVLVVLAFYAFARISVGSTFIACMLTIVGYSINATIVIFDRVRETLRTRSRQQTLAEVVNESVTDTLSRSIFTSLTTFFMVLALFIFGVASVKEFALPIMIGIICGAYSSVCLAGSIWYVLRKNSDDAARKSISSGKGSGSGKSGGQQPAKKKDDYSNLSKKERKERRRKEEEAKNKAKITV